VEIDNKAHPMGALPQWHLNDDTFRDGHDDFESEDMQVTNNLAKLEAYKKRNREATSSTYCKK
jgi:hypothetical protein